MSEKSTEEQWFYTHHQNQQGPVTFTELKALVKTETLQRDTLIWKEGMMDWTQASAIKELFVTPPPIPIKSEKRQPPPLPQKALTQTPSLTTSPAALAFPSSDLLILCNNCHFLGIGKSKRRGNFFVNWILMLVFVLPGVFYFLWRMCSPRLQKCPQCDSLNTIPAKSMAARKVIAELNEDEIANLHVVVKKENARLTGQFISYTIILSIPIILVISALILVMSVNH